MSLLINWKPQDFATLEQGVLVANHALAESGLFSDEGLAKILDQQPDSALTLSTMGEDSNTFEWRDGDRNNVSGHDLLQTVKRGKLWINCREILQHQPEVARLVNAVYDQLESVNKHFRRGSDGESADFLANRDRSLPR